MDQAIEIRDAFFNSERRYALKFVDENGQPELSLTKQADKDQTDIQNIIARYKRTGLIEHVAKGVAMYGDFTEVNEYQEALNRVIRARQSFQGLPSDVRDRFDNDPGRFFEFATDPKNLDEMRKMGLANAEAPAPKPVKVEVINPAIPSV